MKDGGPAFPTTRWDEVELADGGTISRDVEYPGMSLRDWFAGQALMGWMASFGPDVSAKPQKCAAFAYELADAMLAERDK